MKLYLNGTSPFARVARASALELGVDLELEWVDPWSSPPDLLAVNPLGRIPVLIDGTEAFTETPLIVARLGGDTGSPEFGLAQGMMEVAFAAVIHAKHCGDGPLQDRRRENLSRALVHADKLVRDGGWSLARLALWIAVDYIRFRNVVPVDHPALLAFMDAHAGREALLKTAFA